MRDGIPILLPPGLDTSHIRDEVDHLYQHKRQQANYFDRELAVEFEIVRPHGTPLAYQWLTGAWNGCNIGTPHVAP